MMINLTPSLYSIQKIKSTSLKSLYKPHDVKVRQRHSSNLDIDSCYGCLDPATRSERYASFKRVLINVSGEKYETLATTLNRYPSTLLGTDEKREQLKDGRNEQIFIDRNRVAFEAVLFFYQSDGFLSKPFNLNMEEFESECLFYELPDSAIKNMKARENYIFKKSKSIPNKYNRIRQMLWQFIDYPSLQARKLSLAYFIFSYTLVVCSIAVFCIASEVRHIKKHFELQDRYEDYINTLNLVEMILNIYFFIELIVRLICFPWPRDFFKQPLNLAELISILLNLILYKLPYNSWTNTMVQFSRVLRVLSLTRFSRISKHVKVATSVFRITYKDLLAVLYIIIIICILCGSIMYYIEMKEPNTKFTSIPESMWWAIQTVLCLGYGDILPTSAPGKIVGCFILYFGVTVVTVLVLALGGRYFELYSREIYKKDFLPAEKIDYEVHYN